MLVANLTAGRLAARFGVRRILVGGALLMTVSLAGLLPLDARIPCAAIVGQLALLGLGLGLIVPAMTSALLGSVDRSRSGIASGTLNTARQRGSTIGVALFGSLSAVDVVAGLRMSLTISIALGLLVSAVGAVAVSDTAPPGQGSAYEREHSR